MKHSTILLLIGLIITIAAHSQEQPEATDFLICAEYDWNMQDSIWNDTLRFVRAVEDSAMRDEQLYERQNGIWEHTGGAQYLNTSGDADTTLFYSIGSSGSPELTGRILEVFENGRLVEYRRSTYSPTLNDWSDNDRVKWQYDGAGDILTEVTYGWNIVGGQNLFIPADSAFYFYDSQGQVDSIFTRFYTGVEWIYNGKEGFEYNSIGQRITYTKIAIDTAGNSIPGERQAYFYNTQGEVEQTDIQYYNPISTSYETNTRFKGEYISGTSLIEKHSFFLVSDTGEALLQFTEYDYQSDTLVESRGFFNQFGMNVIGTQRLTYSYPLPAAPVDTTDTLVDDTTGTVGLQSTTANVFLIYPNPAREYVVVTGGEGSKMLRFVLFNSMGQPVREERLSQRSTAQINLEGLPQGNYFYRVLMENGESKTGILQRQ